MVFIRKNEIYDIYTSIHIAIKKLMSMLQIQIQIETDTHSWPVRQYDETGSKG